LRDITKMFKSFSEREVRVFLAHWAILVNCSWNNDSARRLGFMFPTMCDLILENYGKCRCWNWISKEKKIVELIPK
jgi:hypothetical protein